MQDQHQQDASKLKVQLTQAENRTKNLQKEVLLLLKLYFYLGTYMLLQRKLYEEAAEQCCSTFIISLTLILSLPSMRTLRFSCQT